MHPVLRREAGRGDPELLQSVGERQWQVGVVLRVIVHRAVEQVGDAEGQTARHRYVDGSPEATAVRAAGVDSGADHHEQTRHLPPLQWHLEDSFVFHHLADARALDVHQRGCGFNRDCLLEVADAERYVDGGRGRDLEHDAGLHVGAESLEGDFEPVGSW